MTLHARSGHKRGMRNRLLWFNKPLEISSMQVYDTVELGYRYFYALTCAEAEGDAPTSSSISSSSSSWFFAAAAAAAAAFTFFPLGSFAAFASASARAASFLSSLSLLRRATPAEEASPIAPNKSDVHTKANIVVADRLKLT